MGTCFSVDTNSLVEKVVCKEEDLQIGEIKEVRLGDQKGGAVCVVVKDEEGKVHALSGKCTHYGANLAKGSYANGVIRCPWHGACFNVTSGDIEDFPGLDSLHKFEVNVENGEVKVRARKNVVNETKRVKDMVKRDPDNPQTVVVVGGGGAAQACVETLRQDGNFKGRIVMITKEKNLPYDRPKLSKAMASTGEDLRLRDPAFYDLADIEVMTEMEVMKVDTSKREVVLQTDDAIPFDKLVLATGSSPRTMDVPGGDLGNVFVVRTPEDANRVSAAGRDRNVFVIGTSFIGMEVAAFFADKAKAVTVMGQGSVPFEKSLGKQVGQYFRHLHEKKGVNFIMNDSIEQFVGNDDGNVAEVTMASGTSVQVDVVVLGIGVKPNTSFLEGSGIDLDDRGSVLVNENLETNVEGVFAAGDIAAVPMIYEEEQNHTAIGHWQLALAHGRCAALNVAGIITPMTSVPFFWTAQFGKSVRFAGYNQGFDDLVIQGDVEEGEFEAYYCKGDKVVAVATLGRDPVAADFANLLKAKKFLNRTDVQSKWSSKL